MPSLRAAAIVLASLPLVACSSISLNDDIDEIIDWTPFAWTEVLADTSNLHSPYVTGAQFTLWLHGNHVDVRRWRVESSDTNVVTVASGSGDDRLVSFLAKAKAPGSANLRVLDDGGSVQMERALRVAQPDRIDLVPHGPLIIDGSGTPEEHPLVLAGGTGTFMARYWAGGERLSGVGALSVGVPIGVDATAMVAHTEFLEDRDWLRITAGKILADGTVKLRIGDDAEAKVWPFTTVAESAIDHVRLIGQNEADAHKDDRLVVYAQAYNAAATPIYGVEYRFTANGVAQDDGNAFDGISAGDLYRYKFDAAKPVMLEATHEQHVQGVMIRSGGGYVDSTNNIGCSTVPGAPSGHGAWPIVALLILAWGTRRRYV